MKRLGLVAAIGVSLFSLLQAQDAKISLRGHVAWDQFRLHATSSLDLAAAGLSLPTGRAQAEELAAMEFPDLVLAPLLRLPVDSADDLSDLIDRGEYALRDLGSVSSGAQKAAPYLSVDLQTLNTAYAVDLLPLQAALIRHRTATDVPRTLMDVPSRPYTGIIILADDPLPVHGKKTVARGQPCFFPKIWDSDMNLLYERNMVDPLRAKSAGIVRYAAARRVLASTPTGLDDDLRALVGDHPARILARGFFGVRPTDPIIDRNDALELISREENRRLLREGRVVIVLAEEVLAFSF